MKDLKLTIDLLPKGAWGKDFSITLPKKIEIDYAIPHMKRQNISVKFVVLNPKHWKPTKFGILIFLVKHKP